MLEKLADTFYEVGNDDPIKNHIVFGRGAIPRIFRDERHGLESVTSHLFGIPDDSKRVIINKNYKVCIAPDDFKSFEGYKYDRRAIGFYHSGNRTIYLKDRRGLQFLTRILDKMDMNDPLDPASGLIYAREPSANHEYIAFVVPTGQRRERVLKNFIK